MNILRLRGALDEAIEALTKARLILDEEAHYAPTSREATLLELAAQGNDRSQVAKLMGLSVPRVAQIVAHLKAQGVDVPTPRTNTRRVKARREAQSRVDYLRAKLTMLEVADDEKSPSQETIDATQELEQAEEYLRSL